MGVALHRMTTSPRYTRVATTVHWLLAVLLAGQVTFGWLLNAVERGTPARSFYVNMHKSVGIVLGLLILFRLFWRLTHRAPALPASMPLWQRVAAHLSHFTLYACMLVLPLSGYIGSNFSRWGIKLFDLVHLPPWGVDNAGIYAALTGVHIVTAWVFSILIGVHVLAALWHALQRDGVFARMGGAARSPQLAPELTRRIQAD